MLDYTTLKTLVEIDSPSGFTQKASQYIHQILTGYGWEPSFSNKGAVRCTLGTQPPSLAIAAHVDTLGAVVAGIQEDGSLRISKVGGLSLNGFEGAYCRIYTLTDQVYTGTLLLDNPAAHVNKDLNSTQRSLYNMHIRLDELASSKKEVEDLGINVGDFICFETNYQELPSGYIKSRFMDNKSGCFVLFELARQIKAKGWDVPVEIFFSNYEEVGHGGTCGYADSIEELLVIDMGVVGTGTAGEEIACSICAKDSSGPYDYEMRRNLVQLANDQSIAYRLDVYPYYGSDGSAALRAGNDYRVGLIGPGVSASHGVERTHQKGIEATIDLCMAYIEQQMIQK
ncbi:M42 family metallopeptidase [Aureispira anguillae]|uniref:M42 family metallopeptidase n=1 Tax=Aureispira anguillae TaxID=2864201 RepID=A0A916DUD1_9BACT|nr:M42 family metallopeptidase [Aureispira anguillae]BDS12146.1 M42 family metallopeptidase [Aureispira anguillae]